MALEHCSENFIISFIPVFSEIPAVGEDMSSCFVIKIPDISEKSIVIVSACIRNTMIIVVVRQMRGTGVSEECKLKNSHSRESAVFNEFCNFGGNVSEVFRNKKFVGAEWRSTIQVRGNGRYVRRRKVRA